MNNLKVLVEKLVEGSCGAAYDHGWKDGVEHGAKMTLAVMRSILKDIPDDRKRNILRFLGATEDFVFKQIANSLEDKKEDSSECRHERVATFRELGETEGTLRCTSCGTPIEVEED